MPLEAGSLEPAAEELIRDVKALPSENMDFTVTHAASLVSIAISLKRIADEVCGDTEHISLVNGIMHAIEQGILAGGQR